VSLPEILHSNYTLPAVSLPEILHSNYTLPAVSLSEILHSTQNPITFDFDTFPTPTQHSLLNSNG